MRFRGANDRPMELGELSTGADRPSSLKPPSSRRRRPSGSRPRVRLARVVLADPDAKSREALRGRLTPLASEIHEAANGSALEDALLGGAKFHLVIASARLPEPSALQVLARVRRHGVRTPFIVVTSTHGNMLRIFVSDAEGTVLSSRMVDDDNLAMLITSLIDEAGR